MLNRIFKYVKKVTEGYKTLEYKSEIQLNKTLDQNVIINQTDWVLSDSQIEWLALGLKFIPSFSVGDLLEEKVRMLGTFIEYP